MHYCGVNPHLFAEVLDIPKVYGINFGNPEKHDMFSVLRECAKKGVVYYGGIPGSDDWAFKDLLRASRRPDGSGILLLSMSCGMPETDMILAQWARAVGSITNRPQPS